MDADDQLTGIDRVRTMLAQDVASEALGIEALEVGIGSARMRMTVRPDMVQGYGTCHGGLVFALADTAFAAACNGRGHGPVFAASAEITWVSPAFAGDVLIADAGEHTRYGRHGVTDVRVTRQRDGELVALFRGRSLELPERPAPTAPTARTAPTATEGGR
ncbi:MAG TPA: hydroxyphenylacetyl-CoA thioesterase PaaI [Kineosporiaceae bacterium]|nr:hydroxyphenylacetyl-CoA thioesterase PaaI [Kineosporiaceae bacterium]